MRQWRLIYDIPTGGAENMAVDAAILDAVSEGRVPPTLRLYGWNPACLSLGYGQRVSDADLERLASRGWDIVRRPTGGKAILHTDELTYSVALPIQHPLAVGGVIESYREISKALLAALNRLGATARADAKPEGGAKSAVCFETSSHYEVTVDGKKLVGSAQLRRKGSVLQHGSLPLYGDITRICDVLCYEDEAARVRAKEMVRKRATTLEGVFSTHPRPLSLRESISPTPDHSPSGGGEECEAIWKSAADAIVCGFETELAIDFEVGSLTDDECEDVLRLRREVYGNEAWTMRR
jgi:lipoate-protein ligase A